MKKTILLILTVLLAFTLTACKDDEEDIEDLVFVTIYPMEYLVEEIAGDTVTVKRIPGSTTHGDYVDWTTKEIIEIRGADLLFYINSGVDDFIPDKAETFEDGDVELIDMSKVIEYNQVCYSHSHDEDEEESEEHTEEACDNNALSDDPHFWLDPVRMLEAAEYVRDTLILTYPENTEVIQNNYTALEAALTQLNLDFETMATEAEKPLITTVMLFTYWHERYDLDIDSITSSAHSSELIPGDIIDFVNLAIEENIDYILFEKNANSPAGDQLLQELQNDNPEVSALYLHGCGNLTMDEIEDGETYLSLMYENLEVLKTATK